MLKSPTKRAKEATGRGKLKEINKHQSDMWQNVPQINSTYQHSEVERNKLSQPVWA